MIQVKQDVVTVDTILSTPCEYDHTLEIRSVGPAVVFVLERDAPLRMETLASTEAEFEALKETCRNDPRWNELLDVYFALKAEEEGAEHRGLWFREDDHAERLAAGRPVSSLRVAD
jgi:hypothetical protein